MIDELKVLAQKKGDKLEVISINRIKTMQKELNKFQNETELNELQKWAFNKLYNYESPNKIVQLGTPKQALSLIIVAVPRPAYANISFIKNGKEFNIYGTVTAPLERAKRYIWNTVMNAGYSISTEDRLPLKRLAVHSGLAEYGKNNITYISGMGSYFALVAFKSDMPCEQDCWREVTVSSMCENCDVCVNNCPTGAIKKDKFIIDSQKCFTAMNQSGEDFPDWLPCTAHHTPFDCLKCQACCPINAESRDVIDVIFDEVETERILAGKPYNDVSKVLKEKINLLGLGRWWSTPRNLRVLFDLMDKGYKPEL